MNIIPMYSSKDSVGNFIYSNAETYKETINRMDTTKVEVITELVNNKPDFMVITKSLQLMCLEQPKEARVLMLISRAERFFEDSYCYDQKESIAKLITKNMARSLESELYRN